MIHSPLAILAAIRDSGEASGKSPQPKTVASAFVFEIRHHRVQADENRRRSLRIAAEMERARAAGEARVHYSISRLVQNR